MRDMTDALAARLGREATTLALCWRVRRRDGVALGFTAHDRAIGFEGLTYRPAPGAVPSAIEASAGFEVDTLEFAGALGGDAISAADLAAGRFDGAAIELFLIDWDAPETGRLALAAGRIGAVERDDGGFRAEVLTPAAALQATPIELVSPECRAELGDRRCRVDLAPLTSVGTVAAVVEATRFEIAGLARPAGWFAYGSLRPLDGPAAGLRARIGASDGATIELREPLPVRPGDRIELRAGCDKRFETCRSRFGNELNFRGEPHVPGTDALVRYPSL